ncbi:MAG: hypothetical protein IJQ81_12885 [Oscillibacter sp.]|nr:hypothetical protein [Oscillibacter sp.]
MGERNLLTKGGCAFASYDGGVEGSKDARRRFCVSGVGLRAVAFPASAREAVSRSWDKRRSVQLCGNRKLIGRNAEMRVLSQA